METKTIDENHQTEPKCRKGHAGIKHLGMMLLCCMVPLVTAFGLKQLGYSGIASYLVLLLCPIMHLFMMKDMFTNRDEAVSGIKKEN